MAKKTSGKKNYRLRRRARRTMGVVCLVTAIVVAAIPVPEASAAEVKEVYTWDKNVGPKATDTDRLYTSVVPIVAPNCKNIYTTEDGKYNFAFVPENSTSSNYVAVILEYNGGNLEGNALNIPNTVNAYTRYNPNQGAAGYVAVGRSGNLLYYKTVEEHDRIYTYVPLFKDDGVTPSGYCYDMDDPNQTPILIQKNASDKYSVNIDGVSYEVEVTENAVTGDTVYTRTVHIDAEYALCYRDRREDWEKVNGQDRSLEDFYYMDASGVMQQTGSKQEYQWIKDQPVAYIGNQYLQANAKAGQVDPVTKLVEPEWMISSELTAENKYINVNPSKGIFAEQTNIVSLTVGDNLKGIGNYAFFGCTGLNSITLANGIEEIGKSAFEGCRNMSQINLDANSNLKFISDCAFRYCEALSTFNLPVGVTAIFDRAFEGCTALGRDGSLNLNGEQGGGGNLNVSLNKLGCYVFSNCSGLKKVTLPASLGNTSGGNTAVYLNNFAGCSSLESIRVESANLDFIPNTATDSRDTFTVENFKAAVPDTFYFEGYDTSKVHELTQENVIAFKYYNEELYEIITLEDAVGGGKAKLTYRVDNQNNLTYFNMEKSVAQITLPAAIGPFGISTIKARSFSGNCYLEKIIIPATVTRIEGEAFRGCHNLKHVIFTNAETMETIENGAFDTQDMTGLNHATGCTSQGFDDPSSSSFVAHPTLTFTGTIGDAIEPFRYAMEPANNLNVGGQNRGCYITYYSGWPTNLEVQYVEGKGATLVDYPAYGAKLATYADDSKYPYITAAYKTAAQKALSDWVKFNDPNDNTVTEMPTEEYNLIQASLHVEVPAGVHAIDTGLFSGKTAEKDASGNYVTETKDFGETYYKPTAVTGKTADKSIESITFASVDEFEPYMIDGCASLKSVSIGGGQGVIDPFAFASTADNIADKSALQAFTMAGTESGSVGDYAFDNNINLMTASLSPTVSSMGLRPFRDCPVLAGVDFGGGPYFTTDNGIIFSCTGGSKTGVVECLEARGNSVGAGTIRSAELAGVTTVAPEAFMDCDGLGSVDFSGTGVTEIPERALMNTTNLNAAVLPTTCRRIKNDAFANSGIRSAEIPSSVVLIENRAFNYGGNPPDAGSGVRLHTIEFYCEPESVAYTWTKEGGGDDYIIYSDKPLTTTFRVTFINWDDSIFDEQEVLIYTDATKPILDPVREGYRFLGWRGDYTNISRDTPIYAEFEKIDSTETLYTVSFVDWDDEVLYTQQVPYGGDCIPPQNPVREGYTFTGWRPGITGITENTTTYAQYEKEDPAADPSASPGGPGTPGNPAASPSPEAKLYTLTVQNGSGSGSYVAGATVIILANEPAKNQEFSKWVTDRTDLKIASTSVGATTLIMPEADVTVTATYTTKSTSGGSTGSSSSGGGGNTVSGGTVNKTGTVIVIDKNGLSNTGVVSATVKGSSDNFVIKITENAGATESIIRALMAEYGSLDNLKYFPMDISLYDSSGNTRITDTRGLSITITLPLPDSMIVYAGNNKVAGVVNDKLDKLSPKFTTIDGVPCITFTAEHFSPYVIYVDTTHLDSYGVVDNSPKTGDLQPKWFFVIGLVCMSVILFVKKDKVTGAKVPVKAGNARK